LVVLTRVSRQGEGPNYLGKTFFTFDAKIKHTTATSTSPFGCNDEGDIVGSFTDSNGNIHGFIFAQGRFFQFDAAGSSQMA
jgi:probable HAF family extracellular repeat protein